MDVHSIAGEMAPCEDGRMDERMADRMAGRMVLWIAGWNPGRREYGIQEDTLDVAVARDGRVTRMNSNLDGIVDAWVNSNLDGRVDARMNSNLDGSVDGTLNSNVEDPGWLL